MEFVLNLCGFGSTGISGWDINRNIKHLFCSTKSKICSQYYWSLSGQPIVVWKFVTKSSSPGWIC